MSDGNLHLERNLPTLLAGAGTDLRFGQEVGAATDSTPFANLLVEVAQQLNLTQITQMGNERNISTGRLAAIKT